MSVTPLELTRYACALIGEQPADDPDTLTYAPVWITVILARLFGVENQIRAAKGEAALASPYVVTEIDSTPIPYDEELLLGPVLYRLAAALCSVNGDGDGAEDFLEDYRETLRLVTPVTAGETQNMYP